MKITFLIILTGLFLSNTFQVKPEKIEPTVFAKNIDLKGYAERKTYQLNQDEYIIVASPEESNVDDEGLRLIYLKRSNDKFKIEYVSQGAGESYIFNPEFYEFEDSTKLIFAELGSEYSWGLEAYELQNGNINYLGFLDIADGSGVNASNVAPNMIIQRDMTGYTISFKNKVIINPGGADEKVVDGREVIYGQKQGKFVMMNK